jgi:transcriptional regulator with XRE-family HTH domain
MPTHPLREAGRRIAVTRRARRMTQADLARAAYVSLATIKAIERGTRMPSGDTLDSIAALPAISAAIAAYDLPGDPPEQSVAGLIQAIDTLVDWRLGAQYARIAKHAPGLLADTLAALHHATGRDRLRAARLVATTARAADAVAYKFGQ